MARDTQLTAWMAIRRILFGVVIFLLLLVFILWRLDGPRTERIRFAIIDMVLPPAEVVTAPMRQLGAIMRDFRGYTALYDENRNLRQELQQMESWREAALQLEQTNAELRALNNLSVSPARRYVTGEVIADAGSPFARSLLLNVGQDAGVREGAAAVDGLGLVGRVSGLGETTSRVVLLSDRTSQISALVMPERARSIVSGDNTLEPRLDVIDSGIDIRAGARVVTSGDGGVLPPDILIGYVIVAADGQLRLQPAANFRGLEFLRVILPERTPDIPEGQIVLPEGPSPNLPETVDSTAGATE